MKKTIRYILFVGVIFFVSTYTTAQTCNLVCSDQLYASLQADSCQRTFDPKDFLKNPDLTCTAYTVNLSYPFGTNKLNGTKVDASHVGYTMVYEVKNGINGCWGYVTIEDKAIPLPLCKSGTISCFQFGKINEIAKQVIDNCTQEGKSIIESLDWDDYGCMVPGVTGRVIRQIRTWDKWGNSGTCKDTLFIRRDSFPLVKGPDMINLSCLMVCKKAKNTKSSTDIANFDTFTFSPNKNDANYPSPKLLITLQERDTFGSNIRKCIPSDLRVVPFIQDSVFRWVGNECFRDDTCISMFESTGLLCKMMLSYDDVTFNLCGNGFKIRREWRLTDWCAGKDSSIVQYITIEDKQKPIVKDIENLLATTVPHDCYAIVNLPSLEVMDCSPYKQTFIATSTDPNTGKIIIQQGDLPANNIKFLQFESALTAHKIEVTTIDACYNQEITEYNVLIRDDTPPTPICDQEVQVTVDPATCWARVYARDLDNGSHDNCCKVLHFAVARMADIDTTRKIWEAYWAKNCAADRWKYKTEYDYWLEDYINCFVFEDYIDLTECNVNQVVLRVYEACGVPKYDPHVFPCSEHDWFCYNNWSSIYRAWHNYTFFHIDGEYLKSGKDLKKACAAAPTPLCAEEIESFFSKIQNDYGTAKFKNPYADYTTSEEDRDNDVYDGSFYFGGIAKGVTCQFIVKEETLKNYSYPPGNGCSFRLYNDCMLNIYVDDKTPPIADEPTDKFWYCDNVSSVEGDVYEYAKCNDESWEGDNGRDKTCVDQNGLPYNYIESSKENDSDASDTIDGVKKYFGWYGCNKYNPTHDEHGNAIPCDNTDSWAPVYCRSWLILDKKDAAGKVNPKTGFDSPILRSGAPTSEAPAGKFYIWDNCWIDPKLDSTDKEFFDKCGNGWIQRSWTAKDKCGNTVSVDQKIVTKHRSDFEVLFPADKLTTCGNKEDISPDAIGRPIIMDDECELVGVNFEDQKFDIVPDACYKIVRTWRIIDWCKYNPDQHSRDQEVIVDDRNVADETKRPCVYRHVKDNGDGYMTYIQIIVIKDTIKPEINIKDTTICFYDNSCFVQSIHIPFAGLDNCTKNEFLSYRYEIDENPAAADLASKTYNKNSIDKAKGGITSLTITQKVGTALVHVMVEDNCGNEDTTSFVLTIKDCKKPTPYCYHGIATVVMPSTGEIKVWAKDLNAGSYDNCTPNEKLKFHFGKELKDSCKVFDCKDIPNGVSFTVPVEIYVTDEAGNTDFCKTFVDIQDNSGNVCDNAKSIAGSVSGSVKTKEEVQIENTLIEALSSSPLPSYKTASNGQFAFINIPLKSAISLSAKRNDEPANGVTTTDILKIHRHILGLEPFNDPYSFIAADINNDKELTTADLVELRKLILNINESFINNTSWRFVPKSFKFSPNTPLEFPEKINIASLDQDELNKDFTGIKIGDLNQTAKAHSLRGTESRSQAKSIDLHLNDLAVNKGDIISLDFTSEAGISLQAFQFTLSHKQLELVGVTKGALQFDQKNIGLFDEYTTISWTDPNNSRPIHSEVLFTIKLKAKAHTLLSENIFITSKITPVEAYDGKEILNIGLKWNNPKQTITKYTYSLDQNVPNPFKQITNIGFELPQAEKVDLIITDIMGKNVMKTTFDGKKGYNQWIVNSNVLSTTGIYYYSVESKNFTETKKMIYVK